MKNRKYLSITVLLACLMSFFSIQVFAHGDVAPQPINIDGLEDLGDEWLERNPYSGNETAIKVGEAAYGQNCARCHGLGGISGGINPDLRKMKHDAEDDAWFVMRVRNASLVLQRFCRSMQSGHAERRAAELQKAARDKRAKHEYQKRERYRRHGDETYGPV